MIELDCMIRGKRDKILPDSKETEAIRHDDARVKAVTLFVKCIAGSAAV